MANDEQPCVRKDPTQRGAVSGLPLILIKSLLMVSLSRNLLLIVIAAIVLKPQNGVVALVAIGLCVALVDCTMSKSATQVINMPVNKRGFAIRCQSKLNLAPSKVE